MFLDIDLKNSDAIAAISDSGEFITYGQLVDQSDIIKELIGTRKLVFIMCRNQIGALTGYVSMMISENVPLLLSADMDEDMLLYLLNTYKPNYMILCILHEQFYVKKYF